MAVGPPFPVKRWRIRMLLTEYRSREVSRAARIESPGMKTQPGTSFQLDEAAFEQFAWEFVRRGIDFQDFTGVDQSVRELISLGEDNTPHQDLSNYLIEGEVLNYQETPSGHAYAMLKCRDFNALVAIAPNAARDITALCDGNDVPRGSTLALTYLVREGGFILDEPRTRTLMPERAITSPSGPTMEFEATF